MVQYTHIHTDRQTDRQTDKQAMEVVRNRTVAAWNFYTDMTDYNRQVMVS